MSGTQRNAQKKMKNEKLLQISTIDQKVRCESTPEIYLRSSTPLVMITIINMVI